MTKKLARRWIERNQTRIARLNLGQAQGAAFVRRLKLCMSIVLADK